MKVAWFFYFLLCGTPFVFLCGLVLSWSLRELGIKNLGSLTVSYTKSFLALMLLYIASLVLFGI